MYSEKPDIETAILPYTMVKTEDEAQEYMRKHRNDVIAPMYAGRSGAWVLIGPWKDVEEKVCYYNEHTQILEEMIKQQEMDNRLAEDLVKKRVKRKKAENVANDGPDDPAFKAWLKRDGNDRMEGFGAKKYNDDDKECPENAVQVDVFRLSHGTQKVLRDKFYTEAEPPELPDIKQS